MHILKAFDTHYQIHKCILTLILLKFILLLMISLKKIFLAFYLTFIVYLNSDTNICCILLRKRTPQYWTPGIPKCSLVKEKRRTNILLANVISLSFCQNRLWHFIKASKYILHVQGGWSLCLYSSTHQLPLLTIALSVQYWVAF